MQDAKLQSDSWTSVLIDPSVVRSKTLKHQCSLSWWRVSPYHRVPVAEGASLVSSYSPHPCHSQGLNPGRSRHPAAPLIIVMSHPCGLSSVRLFELSQACGDWQAMGMSFEIIIPDIESAASVLLFPCQSLTKLSFCLWDIRTGTGAFLCARNRSHVCNVKTLTRFKYNDVRLIGHSFCECGVCVFVRVCVREWV